MIERGNYDVIVVGAGIIGLSTAYHIKKKRPSTRILVIDQLSSAGQANTAKSASAFRCLFSSETNHVLADSSVEFYRYLQENQHIDLKLKWIGYLVLLTKEDHSNFTTILRGVSKNGGNYKVFNAKDLASHLHMNVSFGNDEDASLMQLKDVSRGLFIPKAGVFDADCLVRFYEEAFLKLGGKIEYEVHAKNLLVYPCKPLGIPNEPYFWQEATIVGVNTNIGVITAKKTVLATGPWIPQFLDVLGTKCHIKPKKRQIFCIPAKNGALRQLLSVKGFSKVNCLPFTILPDSCIYIRPFPDEGVFWIGCTDDFMRSFKLEDTPQAEKNFYEYGIYQVLIKYFPQFKNCKPTSSFAGLYGINTLDGQPVIFEEKDLIVVGGPSGSGIIKADAIGRIAAALCAEEKYAELWTQRTFKVSDLGLKNRYTEPEKLVF